MSDLEKVEALTNGEHYVVPESDYGKAEIWFINGEYFLFEIPTYGGQPMYSGRYSNADDALRKVNSWT